MSGNSRRRREAEMIISPTTKTPVTLAKAWSGHAAAVGHRSGFASCAAAAAAAAASLIDLSQ